MSRSNSTLLMLVFAGGFALLPSTGAVFAAQSPARVGSAPLAADPHEPVTGGIRIASSPADRGEALALLERARQHGLSHRAGFPPFRLEAIFSAGSAAAAGQGQLTETWLSGQKWLWTASLGSYSVARSVGFGTASDAGAVPMRIHMLRSAIFWAERPIEDRRMIRTASIQWNGRPATCILVSGMPNPAEATRLWEESEYCIDNASGVLQVESIAPGTYSVYSYDKGVPFHGQAAPDRIRIYVSGAEVLNAQVSLTDAGSVDEATLRPTPEMIAAGPAPTLSFWQKFEVDVPGTSVSGLARPVTVHASVDGNGRVVEQELSATSDAALVEAALNTVKSRQFPPTRIQRQIYVNVRFVPAAR